MGAVMVIMHGIYTGRLALPWRKVADDCDTRPILQLAVDLDKS